MNQSAAGHSMTSSMATPSVFSSGTTRSSGFGYGENPSTTGRSSLFTFSANPPIVNGQMNQSAAGHAMTSSMATPSAFSSGTTRSSGFGYGENPSTTGRSPLFTFSANLPIANGQMNQSAAGHSMTSSMATPSVFSSGTTRSSGFGYGENPSTTGRSSLFTFSANPPIANGQMNQSAAGHAMTSSMATPSAFSSGTTRSSGFGYSENPSTTGQIFPLYLRCQPADRERPDESECGRPRHDVIHGDCVGI
ncbi:hypothetical protein MTO96_003918 [Rhipicephalus appendiculatus]